MSATDAKAALVKAIQDAGGWRTLTLGGTTYLHVGANHDEVYADLVKKAIRSGEAIHHPDGSREFYEWVAVWDSVKGAERETAGYTWKPGDGNLCKHELIKTVVDKQNAAVKTVVRTAWRKLNFD